MALRNIGPMKNGSALRKCSSWIEEFVRFTSDLESPENYRRWTAIGILAAALEQAVWIEAGHGVIYPNQYIWLIGPPATGKSNPIKEARKFLMELPEREKFIAPTSLTAASLSDAVAEARRTLTFDQYPADEYNSLTLLPDELGAFMTEYDKAIVGLLTTMYDCDVAYGEDRRTTKMKLRIPRPQINMIAGCTPSYLMEYVPKNAWDQGFTSRIMLVHGMARPDRHTRDPFVRTVSQDPTDLHSDLLHIDELYGQMKVEPAFKEKLQAWRKAGCLPVQTHPRLKHYNGRRWAHVMKLAMISCVDRGNSLTIAAEDFDRATKWLFDAELNMPIIFDQGSYHADSAAQDELIHFIDNYAGPIPEYALVRQARKLLPVSIINRTIEMFEKAGIISKLPPNPRLKGAMYTHDPNQSSS
jgi:hypothetical protein